MEKLLSKNNQDTTNNYRKGSTIQSRKKKRKNCVQEIQFILQYDDEPSTNKYQSLHNKQHAKIYYDKVDILDQGRYKFILSINDKGGTEAISKEEIKLAGNYTKYSNQTNLNINWEDIYAVVYYSVDIYNCPICLEKKLVCPILTRCGHIFCWPCIVNFYNYWTVNSPNKKIPNCPLCQELIKINQIKFCDILHSVNYEKWMDNHHNEKDIEKNQLVNNHTLTNPFYTNCITFNLIMKSKKGPILYNTYYDPDLEYYKKHHNQKDAFNFVPLENQEKFSFCRILLTNSQLLMKRFYKIKAELEYNLREELDTRTDEGRVLSLNMCLDNINNKIKIVKQNNSDISIDEEIFSIEKQENNANNINTVNEGISENINENISTIESELLDKNATLDFNNFVYLYQEQFGDIYYLHPINYAILLSEFEKEEHLPTEISGKILEIEMYQTTPQVKNKYPFLNHLHIGSLFFFVEIDLKQVVSNHTLKKYHNILKERAKIRYNIKKEEEHYDNYVKNLKPKKEERKILSEISMNNQKQKISEIFKEDLGIDNDYSQSINIKNVCHNSDIIDRKENKLKFLFEKEFRNKIGRENLKKEIGKKEDIPEIQKNFITKSTTKKISDEEVTENESIKSDHNEYDKFDEASVIVKPKTGIGQKKVKKKKKNVEKLI